MSDAPVVQSDRRARAPNHVVEDKRGRVRHVTSMPATIVISHYDQIPCIVRDLSDGGAKIGLSRRYVLAERFWIVIRHANVTRRASLMWRRGEFAGIAFDHPFE
ncbi:PilZ domain-containing protein [Methylobacterium indicum]|uniref:PilZ domain-containing protein n=1 Tax=Methylobacterium indicum TaxID=1775910 RepID=UPI000A75E6BF|nr:PilZ domain-containing protein [Methylobacterium indicum]